MLTRKVKKWLRLRASNVGIAKLILGHLDEFKNLQNPSLAASPQLKVLMDLVKEAVKSVAEGDKSGEEASMFDDSSKEAPHMKPPCWKQLFHDAPETVTIQVGEVQVPVKTPRSLKETDLVIPLEATILTAVCDYIMEDASDCLAKGQKRQYNQTGKYAKKIAKEEAK